MEKLTYYDPDCTYTHKVKITFQCEECKGSCTTEVGGNCHGFSVLEFAAELNNADIESDCNLRIFEDDDGDCVFSCDLKDSNGNIRSIGALPLDELSDMITAIEIVAAY